VGINRKKRLNVPMCHPREGNVTGGVCGDGGEAV
jgi:hypothetical protein